MADKKKQCSVCAIPKWTLQLLLFILLYMYKYNYVAPHSKALHIHVSYTLAYQHIKEEGQEHQKITLDYRLHFYALNFMHTVDRRIKYKKIPQIAQLFIHNLVLKIPSHFCLLFHLSTWCLFQHHSLRLLTLKKSQLTLLCHWSAST